MLTLVYLWLSGIFPTYLECKERVSSLEEPRDPSVNFPGTTKIESADSFQQTLAAINECNNAKNNLNLGFFIIIIGVSVLVGGYITKRD